MAQPHIRYHAMPQPPEGSNKWVCVYPTYINRDRTVAEGRRLPKEKTVIAPTCKEIMEVLSTTGLQIFAENKIYSREKSKEPQFWGRIRVEIKQDGVPINPKFSTRQSLLLYAAENIPKLKSRTNPKVPVNQQQQGKHAKGKKKK